MAAQRIAGLLAALTIIATALIVGVGSPSEQSVDALAEISTLAQSNGVALQPEAAPPVTTVPPTTVPTTELPKALAATSAEEFDKDTLDKDTVPGPPPLTVVVDDDATEAADSATSTTTTVAPSVPDNALAAPRSTVAPSTTSTITPNTTAPNTTLASTTGAPTTAAPSTTAAPTTVAPNTTIRRATTTPTPATVPPTTVAPTTTIRTTTTTAAPPTTTAPTTTAPATLAPAAATQATGAISESQFEAIATAEMFRLTNCARTGNYNTWCEEGDEEGWNVSAPERTAPDSGPIGPLAPNAPRSNAALAWSTTMAATGDFKHSSFPDVDRGETGGENVVFFGNGSGEAPTLTEALALESAATHMLQLMDSPGHRVNILRASFTSLGIGIAIDVADEGRLEWLRVYGTQQFV